MQVLERHVVPNVSGSRKELSILQTVPTLSGKRLGVYKSRYTGTVSVLFGNPTLDGSDVRYPGVAKVIRNDVQACNSTIHFVTSVFAPWL